MTAVSVLSGTRDDPSPRYVLAQHLEMSGRPGPPAKTAGIGFSFADVIDVLNPLQHLPGISDLYRAVTNDQISEEARKTGQALYGFALGGPVGIGLMMAFDAASDRTQAMSSTAANLAGVEVAPETAMAASSITVAPEPGRNPVDPPLPAAGEPGPLGADVASTGLHKAGIPFDLMQFVQIGALADGNDDRLTAGDRNRTAVSGPGAGDPDHTLEAATAANPVPDEAGLTRLATHASNHLSLDVLKVLQERHAKLSASQQS